MILYVLLMFSILWNSFVSNMVQQKGITKFHLIALRSDIILEHIRGETIIKGDFVSSDVVWEALIHCVYMCIYMSVSLIS